ncbi:uncharacterized protein DS421_10g304960 [Arachis hypogaea]|nr:uncharacterized protein DS421_10g304960 [Arachis hypogaea]
MFIRLELEHENGVPIAVTILVEEPVVHVPRDLNRNAVDFNSLIAPELPLEALYLQHPVAVDGERELGGGRVVIPGGAAVDLNTAGLAAENGGGGVNGVGKDVFLLEEEGVGVVSVESLGLGVGVFGGIAEEENDAVVDDEREVEGGVGFRGEGGRELGLGEVPEESRGGREGFGSVLLPEYEGLYVKLKGGRRRRRRRRRRRGIEGVVVVDLDVEGAA